MATKDKLIEELNYITEKISSLVWILNLGTLGTTWSAVVSTAKDSAFKITFLEAKWIFVLCLLSLLCEMGQYMAGYFLNKKMLDKFEAEKLKSIEYDPNKLLYKWRRYFFYLKIVLTVAAAVGLLVLIFVKLS